MATCFLSIQNSIKNESNNVKQKSNMFDNNVYSIYNTNYENSGTTVSNWIVFTDYWLRFLVVF
jgi:hypothetical protein